MGRVMRQRRLPLPLQAALRAQREFSWDAMLTSYQTMFGTRESVSHE